MSASDSRKTVTIRKRQRPGPETRNDAVPAFISTDEAKKDNASGNAADRKRVADGIAARRPADTADGYEVGYRKPPLASRFTSENQPRRRGRKRRPTSIREVELALMNARYPRIEKGRITTLNGYEMMGRTRLKLALKGNLRAMKEIILNTLPTPEELDEIAQGRPLTEHEVNVWKAMMDIARETGGDNDD